MKVKPTNLTTQSQDVLERSKFHRTLLLFHIPAGWSFWKVAGVGLFFISATAFWWLLITRNLWVAGAVALGLLCFFLIDGFLFFKLPRLGASFGPWQSQLLAISLPRWVFAFLFGFFALFASPLLTAFLMLIIQLFGFIVLLYATLVEPINLKLTHLAIELEQMEGTDDHVRVLHISDIHIERLTKREKLLLEIVQEQKPDLILITGDYPNLSYTRDPITLSQIQQFLGQLYAPYGVIATLGSPPVDKREVVPALFDDLDIRLLIDEWELVETENGIELAILGLDCSHHLPTDRERLSRLMDSSPEASVHILLYHAPDLMPEATGYGIDLYLCGHTHGGQVRLPLYGAILTSSQLGKRYEMGHYQDGRTNLYVSRGVGLEGLSAPRVRFLSPPEITLITISGNNTTSN